MSPKRYARETRRCARSMCRALGQDPDALAMPTEAVFAQMRAGLLAPGVRVAAWRNYTVQAEATLDGLLSNPEAAAVLADPDKIVWKFTTDTP